ncbi:KpsF/GutQ family sugar-phosphate isomerase [Oecophyllibacter saccharovorans]|uniref:KpsF/GutQ family sugar-phosphate isomerase n=1 Tax=Oecophyllibacter saccharovorans TaxID=2558360 RepID=A0A506UQ54_9PROT|nr:KpsF/GutQ family sugar-phosphate isomerase [Oecophyllibacter saccharovorans]QDH15683.1 KpsF/GutQ family sugar-phosphate isomerase [Oecophyllibacter saccharovorans]TPW35460.1 KpsF/GutQ family sugar-phosphate isomerase [Oecophyllibacter saccharovorans]TPW36702.1 KpsF/GutQ family sugar-phosphate isomerase [Oecophyllibacter saccharovorans]
MTSPPLRIARQALSLQYDGLNQLARELEGPLGEAFEQAIDRILHTRGRVVVTGIGKSGHIARKIQSTLASTGTPSLFVHPAEAAHGDLGVFMADDLLLLLSSSGESAELGPLLKHARRLNAERIAITSNPASTLARSVQTCLTLPVVPEACPMGLAPTTSTLLQLALGDALAMALLERRGFGERDFQLLHPGGQLGSQLRLIEELMHTGAEMPLGTPDMPLRQVIVEMTRKAFGCMGVIDGDGRLCGLVSDGDLRPTLERNLDLDSTTAADIMNRKPLTAPPDIVAREALRFMNDPHFPVSSLFVVGPDRRPVGIVHLHDLLRTEMTR